MYSLLDLGLVISSVIINDKTLWVRQAPISLIYQLGVVQETEGALPPIGNILATCVIKSATDLSPLEPDSSVWDGFPPQVVTPLYQEIMRISKFDGDDDQDEVDKKK